jgi:hypothetical protein
MKRNMGRIDRLIRTLVAINIILFYVVGFVSGVFAIILLIFAAIFLVTSLFAKCPLYDLLRIHTNSKMTRTKR